MSNDTIFALLIGILLLQFIAYFMCQLALKRLTEKQQSTMYGVSHVWGSLKELREEMDGAKMPLPLPLPPIDFPKIEELGESPDLDDRVISSE